MEQLKPCPFCGEAFAVVQRIIDGCNKRYQVVCDESSYRKCANPGVFVYGCGASTGLYDARSEAIDGWNRRANNAEQ